MRVQSFEHLVVMQIWMLVWSWVVGVIHAGTKGRIGKNFVLVIKPKGMTNFLAQNKVSPSRSIVFGGVKVGIIELYGALSDMIAVGPDGSNAEPAIIAIFTITDFYATVDS